MLKQFMMAALAVCMLAGLSHSQTTQPSQGGPTTQAVSDDQKVIAEVLETKITQAEQGQLSELIYRSLYDHYVKENGLEPTEAELEAFVEFSEKIQRQRHIEYQKRLIDLQAALETDTLSEKERAEKKELLQITKSLLAHFDKRQEEEAAFNRQATDEEKRKRHAERRQSRLKAAVLFVQRWKLFMFLHQKYGGRVLADKFGPIPIDAHLAFLKEEKKKGHFAIFDPEIEKAFWAKFNAEPSPRLILDQQKGAEILSQPYWLKEVPVLE